MTFIKVLKKNKVSCEYVSDWNIFIHRPNENELFHNRSKSCNFPTATPLSRELWSSDCEGNCKTTSNSDDSLPPVNDVGIPEQRMPRFCYNCGTKYPVVSAKFCCECGARRFILGVNNGQLYAIWLTLICYCWLIYLFENLYNI